MASHAQLGHARSIAKTDYEICKGEGEARARPPRGQNVNKWLPEKLPTNLRITNHYEVYIYG